METYSIGRKFAEENKVELDQNQDLFALGLGNLVSTCFSTWVAAGSFGHTALAQVRRVACVPMYISTCIPND